MAFLVYKNPARTTQYTVIGIETVVGVVTQSIGFGKSYGRVGGAWESVLGQKMNLWMYERTWTHICGWNIGIERESSHIPLYPN